MATPIPFDEEVRLKRLDALGLLDTAPDRRLDSLTARALAAFPGASMAAVSLIDRDRQWFKSAIGLGMTQVPRAVSFCAHAILASRTLLVPDATLDRRFAAIPSVVGELGVRFYAGAPVLGGLGVLCILGTQPRRASQAELALLVELTRLVEAQLLMESALRLLACSAGQCEKMSGAS